MSPLHHNLDDEMASFLPTGGTGGGGEERRFVGLSVSSGVVIGPAYLLTRESFIPPRRALEAEEIPAERARFKNAVDRALTELDTAYAHTADLPKAAREEIQLLLDAHKAMLSGSRLIRGVDNRILRSKINAEAALEAEIETLAKSFASIQDSYLAARIEDVRVLGTRLFSLLLNRPMRSTTEIPKGSILISDDLSPADTARINTKIVRGIASTSGGAQGHAAIMARALGIPAVLALGNALLQDLEDGTPVIIDGRAGTIIIDPAPETLENYKAIAAKIIARRRELRKLSTLDAVTRDGTHIHLLANLEMESDVPAALSNGAEGVGLLRTEFMFMRRGDLPSEEEQYEYLKSVVTAMDGRPVTIRTLDVGGDKIAESMSQYYTSEDNPALGLRGIRFSLKEEELFQTQFSAILRASAHGSVKIMLPMISQVAEVERARRIMDSVIKSLRQKRVKLPDPLPPLGIMIEVPAAVLIADDLAKVADFFSIGTNDLTQYALAVDRANEHVSYLYDSLHPGVLKLLRLTIEAGQRNNTPVSICGEMAGDARVTAMLVMMGIRELSMSHPLIPIVKQQIRALNGTPN